MHPIRRKDREISLGEAKAALAAAEYGTLSTVGSAGIPIHLVIRFSCRMLSVQREEKPSMGTVTIPSRFQIVISKAIRELREVLQGKVIDLSAALAIDAARRSCSER
jgi:hypothetical protein